MEFVQRLKIPLPLDQLALLNHICLYNNLLLAEHQHHQHHQLALKWANNFRSFHYLISLLPWFIFSTPMRSHPFGLLSNNRQEGGREEASEIEEMQMTDFLPSYQVIHPSIRLRLNFKNTCLPSPVSRQRKIISWLHTNKLRLPLKRDFHLAGHKIPLAKVILTFSLPVDRSFMLGWERLLESNFLESNHCKASKSLVLSLALTGNFFYTNDLGYGHKNQ